jgi:hypothetical protein
VWILLQKYYYRNYPECWQRIINITYLKYRHLIWNKCNMCQHILYSLSDRYIMKWTIKYTNMYEINGMNIMSVSMQKGTKQSDVRNRNKTFTFRSYNIRRELPSYYITNLDKRLVSHYGFNFQKIRYDIYLMSCTINL